MGHRQDHYELIATVWAMHREGRTNRQIALALGRNESSISRILNEQPIKPRTWRCPTCGLLLSIDVGRCLACRIEAERGGGDAATG